MVDMDHEIREMLDDDFNDYDEVEKFEDVKDKIKDEKDECELGDIIKELHLDENALLVCLECLFLHSCYFQGH